MDTNHIANGNQLLSDNDWNSPAATIALVIVGTCVALLLAMWAVQGHEKGMERLRAAKARESGHPAGADRDRANRLTVDQRRLVASDVAGILLDAGFRLERDLLDTDTLVRAWGLDGVYTADVGPNYVTTGYQTNTGTLALGRYLSTSRAAQSITHHAGQRSPAS